MKYLRYEFIGRLKTFVTLIWSIGQTIGQQLDCNFDQRSFCNWSNGINGVEDDFDWQIDNTVAVDGFHSIPRTITGSGYFTFAQGRFRPFESDAARAWLRSPTIDGISRPATLSFVYWKTAVPPVLQVCTRDAGDNRLRCLDTISGLGEQRWVQRLITIPGNASPFQIVFVATGFRTALDLVGIDDITFRFGTFQNEEELLQQRRPSYQRRNSDSASDDDKEDRLQSSIIYSTIRIRAGNFPTPPVVFETYRPIYNRVQNTFEYITENDAYLTTPSPYLNQLNLGPTGRPEVFFVAQTRFYGEPPPERYVNSEPPPHIYFTTPPHAYSKSTQHLYITTPEGETEEPTSRQCDAVTCFFDEGFCYLYNDLKANFDWKMKFPEAPARGIPNDTSERLSYAFVSGETRKQDQRAALRSPTFRLYGVSYLEFSTFISDSNSGHLAVKSNDFYGDKVLWETYGYKNLGGHGWNKVRIALPSVKYPITLIFEVNQISTGQYVSIDDLRLTDDSGNDVGCSFNATMYRTTESTYRRTTDHNYISPTTEHRYTTTEHDYSTTEHGYSTTEHGYSTTEHGYSTTDHNYKSTSDHDYLKSTETSYHVGYITTKSEPDFQRELFFQKGEGVRPTFAPPIFHSASEQNNFGEGNGRKLNEELSVDVFGEHGGSIINPERIDAGPTTELIFGVNTDGLPSQFYGDLQSEISFSDNQNKFQNLVDRTHLNRSSNYSKVLGQQSLWLRSTKLAEDLHKPQIRQSPVTTVNPDPLGVGDFVRRVSSDLGSLLGINRQSYIFGADVLNRYPKTDYQLNDSNDWLRHIFGKKKK